MSDVGGAHLSFWELVPLFYLGVVQGHQKESHLFEELVPLSIFFWGGVMGRQKGKPSFWGVLFPKKDAPRDL